MRGATAAVGSQGQGPSGTKRPQSGGGGKGGKRRAVVADGDDDDVEEEGGLGFPVEGLD